MKAPILDNIDLIELGYRRLGHKMANVRDMTPERMRLILGEVLSSGFRGRDSFEKDMEVMNAESRKRFRPSETIEGNMNASRLENGDSEHKGMDSPPEIPLHEFCIDLDRAMQHFRHPYFFRVCRGAPESKSPNDYDDLHNFHEYFRGLDDVQGLEEVSDVESAECFTSTNGSSTSMTKSTSYCSLKSSEEGSISVPGSASSGSSSSSDNSGGVIKGAVLKMKDKLVINDGTNRGNADENDNITKNKAWFGSEDISSELSRSIGTRSRSRSSSDESNCTERTLQKKKRVE